MIEVVEINNKERWDKIVTGFDKFDIYYLSTYVEAFKLHGDGDPMLFYYTSDELKAINVVMRRDISKIEFFSKNIGAGEYFDLSTPYGYGGFLFEGNLSNENIKKLDKEYSEYCLENNIISEFARFHPILNNVNLNENLYDCQTLGKTVTVPLDSKEKIWNTISGKNRNVIRKAIKSGVEIYWGRSSEIMEEFIPMYNLTMDSDDAKNYYYFDKNFYNSILMDLKYNHLIFYAVFEGQIISMAIILYANNQLHYHLSASNREFQRLSATNLLLYEVACWGSSNNFSTFHLGGGLGSQEDNLFKFKESFNKQSDTFFSIGKKVFNQDKYNELVNLRVSTELKMKSGKFFPLYRIDN